MDKKTFFEQYNARTHLYGRIGLVIGIVMMLGCPFAIGLVLNAMPNMPAFWKGFAQVAAVYIPSCIVEFLIYTPMMGSGGSYLAFITGNLINMKIPCMMNALGITEAEAGTPEAEIVSTLSIAASALTTTAVIALGVMLLIPLQPILSSPVLAPAFDNVVPALFGALAYQYFRKGMKIVAIPLTVMTVLFVAVPSMVGSVGFLIIPSGAMAIGIGYVLWKREQKEAA
ncbi:MAG: hypothetical protein E7442_09915 [Ruminococcaceae bacterium]|nr:hypothetical protein [Oscillospiraceae bacterium]